MPEIIPVIKVNDPLAASDNSFEIEKAIEQWRSAPQGARIVFPPGTIWLARSIYLYETEASIILEGQGWKTVFVCTFVGYGADGGVLVIDCTRVGYSDDFVKLGSDRVQITSGDPTNYDKGDCLFLFKAVLAGEVRTPCQTFKMLSKDGNNILNLDRPIDSDEYYRAKFLKKSRLVRGAVTPGMVEVTLVDNNAADAGLFKVGDYAFLSDGAGLSEIYGEFIKIAS